MADLQDRFRVAEQIPAPDLWAHVQERLAADRDDRAGFRLVGSAGSRPRRHIPVLKLLTIASAFALSVGSTMFLVKAFRTSEPVVPGDEAGILVATISFPSELRAIAAGEGAIWVASAQDGTVSRIDPATNQVVATIPLGADVGGPWDIAAGGGAVWVVVGGQAHPSYIVRIDPATNRIVARIAVGNASVLETGLGAVWVGQFSQAGSGGLVRIDTATNRIVATIPVGPEPQGIAVGGGSVWVLDGLMYEVTQVDPSTNTAATVFDGAAGTSDRAWGIAYTAGALWTVECLRTGPPVSEPSPGPGCDWNLVRVDAKTFVTKFIPIATEHEDARHTLYNINTSVAAAGDGSVWVTVADAPPVEGGVGSFANGRLIRIDAAAGQIVGPVDTGPNFAGDATLGDGDVWGVTWGASAQAVVIRIDPAKAATG